MYVGLKEREFDADEIIQCYKRYMAFVVGQSPTHKQFVNNMETKMTDMEFLGDTTGLIRSEMAYDPMAAYQLVKEKLIDKMQ